MVKGKDVDGEGEGKAQSASSTIIRVSGNNVSVSSTCVLSSEIIMSAFEVKCLASFGEAHIDYSPTSGMLPPIPF